MERFTPKWMTISILPSTFSESDIENMKSFLRRHESYPSKVEENNIKVHVKNLPRFMKSQERFIAFKMGYALHKEITEKKESQIMCVRCEPEMMGQVQIAIMEFDSTATFDPEKNPITFWVETTLSLGQVANLKGVVDCIRSSYNENA